MKKPIDCRLPIADCRLKPQMNPDERRANEESDSRKEAHNAHNEHFMNLVPFCSYQNASRGLPITNRKSTIENRQSRSGFVLLVVIIAMAVIGIEMSILGSIANTMQFQSQTAYLQACRRNLTASGLAWTRQNIPNKAGEGVPEAIKLSTGEMDIRGSELDLTISRPPEKEAEVLIKTSCSRGRQMLKGEYRYKLSL